MSKRGSTIVIKNPAAKRQRAPVVYEKGAIPYAVSRPNSFWKIKKDLPAADYWKKRYWRRRITGRGAYRTSRTLRGRGSYTGYGRRVGEYIGGYIGEYAENLATSYITGVGSYTVKKNILMQGNLPEVKNPTGPNSSGGITLRYTEYLTDIFTGDPNTFQIQNFLINPANSKTFPFLSQLAQNYEQYEMEGMIFEFKSTSADALNSTNTALGTIMMATEYDVLDKAFSSKSEMLNYQYASCVKPSENCMHMIECDPRQTSVALLYCLPGNGTSIDDVPAKADPRLYYLGNFFIATTGFQGTNVNIGQLHVTYQVRLLKPKLVATLGDAAPAFVMHKSTSTVGEILYDNDAVLGTGVTVAPENVLINTAGIGNDSTSLRFGDNDNPLSYTIEVMWIGADSGGPTSAPTLSPVNGTVDFYSFAPAGVVAAQTTAVIGFTSDGSSEPAILNFGSFDAPISGGATASSITIRAFVIDPDAADLV